MEGRKKEKNNQNTHKKEVTGLQFFRVEKKLLNKDHKMTCS